MCPEVLAWNFAKTNGGTPICLFLDLWVLIIQNCKNYFFKADLGNKKCF
jgi:hypothetical protein